MKRHNHLSRPQKVVATCATIALALSAVGCGAQASAKTIRGETAGQTSFAQPLQAVSSRVLRATQDARSATVLVYLNGSDLESYGGAATDDIQEMLNSTVGTNVNVVIETLGTREWQRFGIASDHTQRYVVRNGSLELVDDSLGQLDTTSADTLSDFISWGVANYPADRYMLLFWDHGAGPVYGFGYDEFQDDYAALTLDEIQTALRQNSDVHFDLIGMDCCLMSSLETCQVLAPFCDYAVLSEDFEPGVGWSYQNWLSKLEENPGIDTRELGMVIVDDMIAAVKEDPENGDATLALIDESAVPALYQSWIDFAFANKDALLGTNYSQQTEQRGRSNRPFNGGHGTGEHGQAGGGSFGYDGYGWHGGYGEQSWEDLDGWDSLYDLWDADMSYVTMSDYYVTDLMTVASSVSSTEADTLKAAMDEAIVHYQATEGEQGMSGMGITLPYGDAEFYDELARVFAACGIDGEYIAWLQNFVGADGAGQGGFATYDDYGYDSYGYDDYWYDDYGFGYGTGYDYGFGPNAGFDLPWAA